MTHLTSHFLSKQQQKFPVSHIFLFMGLTVASHVVLAHPGYADDVKQWCLAAKRPVPVFTADECTTCHQASSYESPTSYKTAYLTRNLDVFCPAENINKAPLLIIEPSTLQSVTVGESLVMKISATDPDANRVVLSASKMPDQATFDSTTGLFSWTPSVGAIGSHFVVITATDQPDDISQAKTVEQTVTIQVTESGSSNTPPLLVPATTPQTVTVSETVRLDIEALDAQDDRLILSASHLPDGARFKFIGLQEGKWKGTFTWHPTKNQAGQSFSVVFVAREVDTSPIMQASQMVEFVVREASAEASIKKVVVEQANYRKGRLNLAGRIQFKSGVATVPGLLVNINDSLGNRLGQVPMNRKGQWKLTLAPLATVPCGIQAEVNGVYSSIRAVKPMDHSCRPGTRPVHGTYTPVDSDHDDHDD
ncbi:MAG: hypothetical protein RLZZ226_275 [Pseudomonadota bacterium]|jgi:hypothetical protein